MNYIQPDIHQLEKISNWDSNYEDMMEYIKNIWVGSSYDFLSAMQTYLLTTQEISINEEIIQAMKYNVDFWSNCWLHTGDGQYLFFLGNTTV